MTPDLRYLKIKLATRSDMPYLGIVIKPVHIPITQLAPSCGSSSLVRLLNHAVAGGFTSGGGRDTLPEPVSLAMLSVAGRTTSWINLDTNHRSIR